MVAISGRVPPLDRLHPINALLDPLDPPDIRTFQVFDDGLVSRHTAELPPVIVPSEPPALFCKVRLPVDSFKISYRAHVLALVVSPS